MGALDTALLSNMRAGTAKGKPYLVGAKTADYTVSPVDCYGGIITNEGAGGAVTLSLPKGEAGMSLYVYVHDTNTVNISPNAYDSITLAGTEDAVDDDISAGTAGNYAHIVCTEGSGAAGNTAESKWFVVDYQGTWTPET